MNKIGNKSLGCPKGQPIYLSDNPIKSLYCPKNNIFQNAQTMEKEGGSFEKTFHINI